MADQSESSSFLGISVNVWIALILSAAGVLAWTQWPFQDTRPGNAGPALNYHVLNNGQNVEARLWEDPFTAVALGLRAHSHLAPADPEAILAQAGVVGHRTLVLGVMVSGAPYSDDIEARRRTRNAVLAGLYRSGFLPRDPQHIGYFCTDLPNANAVGKCRGGDAHSFAAFEWLASQVAAPAEAAASPADRILVLWLDQDQFRQEPLTNLSQLFTRLATKTHPDVSLAVLGPADSDGLREIYDEAKTQSDSRWPDTLQPMVFYSSRATASESSVLGDPAYAKTHSVAQDLYTKSGGRIEFMRTVSNDDEVAAAIIKELGIRGIQPNEIALVAERDTLYARGMGSYFKGCKNEPRADPMHPTNRGPDTGTVRCFTYLKGLDGLGPVAANPPSPPSEAETSQGGTAKAGSPQQDPSSDTAIGPSQLDYLRRLAATIAAVKSSNYRVRAIGVISSDVYDKLLVLQALREAMPTRTYFTFDLDARLLQPSNLKWTRQLIVGSSLGLALCPALQGDIPSFRDIYQTTTFFATLMAVHRYQGAVTGTSGGTEPRGCTIEPAQSTVTTPPVKFDPSRPVQVGFEWMTSPRIFQIGRTEAYDLYAASSSKRCDVDSDCESIAAVRSHWLARATHLWSKAFIVGVVLALLTILGGVFAFGLRALRGRSRARKVPFLGVQQWDNGRMTLAVMALVIALTLVLWPLVAEYVTQNFVRVPTPFFSGANEWTPTIIDAATVIVVVLLIMRGQRKLHDNSADITREFGFTNSRQDLIRWHRQKLGPGRIRSQCLTLFWFPLRPLSSRYGVGLADAKVSPVEALIAQYLNRGTALARFLRVIATAVLSVVLLVALEAIPGLNMSRPLFELISLLSLFAMQFLILWTADAMLLSRSFILALWRDQPAWPPTTLANANTSLGMSGPEVTWWLDLLLIGERTACVAQLVWYPSCVIAAVALSTLTVQFRDFQFANNPIALIASTAFVIAAAMSLRTAAEFFRSCVMRSLENKRLQATANNPQAAAQLQLLIGRVTDLNEGAFAPYSEQPIVRAVLVPAITYAATVGLQNLHIGSWGG